LQSIHFVEGQMVSQGELLFVIDPRPMEAALARVRAEYDEARAGISEAESLVNQRQAEREQASAARRLAEKRFSRTQQLVSQRAAPQEELDVRESELQQAQADEVAAEANVASAQAALATARAAVETALANIRSAEVELDYTRITAPISGRISDWRINVGNLVNAGQGQSDVLTTIVSLDPIHCYFDADEQAVLRYQRLAENGERALSSQVRNPVYLALADEEGYPHQGHMDFVDNQFDRSTGTLRARAVFPNPTMALMPGMFAELRLPGSGPRETLLIPDAAVGSDQTEQYVYILNEQDEVQRVPVTVGALRDGLRIVHEGLDGSERVVTKGLQSIRPGMAVQATSETLKVPDVGELPNDYQPIRESESLSRQPAASKKIDGSKTS
jgi:multidrug efflux system membrane fusion protein